MEPQTIQNFLLSILGVSVALVVGMLVLSSLQNTQITEFTSCNAGFAQNATLLTQCNNISATPQTKLLEFVPRVNNTKTSNLSTKFFSNAVCTITSAQNASNAKLIPASNWTEITECSIRQTKGALYSNKNWTVNYTTVWDNVTGREPLQNRTSTTVAGNATGSINTQLATMPQWIGIIITVALAFIVLGYFYQRM